MSVLRKSFEIILIWKAKMQLVLYVYGVDFHKFRFTQFINLCMFSIYMV